MATEKQVGAYTVLLLVKAGLLHRSKAEVAMAAVGVGLEDKTYALERFTADGRGAPLRATEVDEPDRDAQERQPVTARSGRRGEGKPRTFPNRREGVEGPERRCPKCKEWLPATAEAFGWRGREGKAKGLLRSSCRGCQADYAARRYLSNAREEALEGVGLRFVVSSLEDCSGLVCSCCELPICPGDEVVGETVLTHTACLGDEPSDARGRGVPR